MARKYLRSDLSEQEAHFIFEGKPLQGEANYLAYLFRFIGKYRLLQENGCTNEIDVYNPITEGIFKHENTGITYIKQLLHSEDSSYYTSRRFLTRLCRKWVPSRVIISFESDKIVRRVFTYIIDHPDLHSACKKFLMRELGDFPHWTDLMPIQADFISTRNDDKHKDYLRAQALINSLGILPRI